MCLSKNRIKQKNKRRSKPFLAFAKAFPFNEEVLEAFTAAFSLYLGQKQHRFLKKKKTFPPSNDNDIDFECQIAQQDDI